MDLLTGLNRERGITVMMVTHEPDMAAYARRIIHFLDGHVECRRSRAGGGVMLLEAITLALPCRSAATRCARS